MTMIIGKLDDFPRSILAHTPTPVDKMPNMAGLIEAEGGPGSLGLYAKRDDCTGLGMGGNKIRQLEFYMGEAVTKGADTILITGAVQSNFVRAAAAAARKVGMDIHIQLEERVADPSPLHRHSGNVLLDRILGATLHAFPEGENEAGADRALESIASDLRAEGKNPYIIHLGPGHPPLGALGYVMAAREIVGQINDEHLDIHEIVVATGSGATHAGLLFGLRALGCDIPIKGICVRRTKDQQTPRIITRCQEIADLLDMDNPVDTNDIEINDDVLAPGYGKVNDAVLQAIKTAAHCEGMILDPVYTGRAMAGFLTRARQSKAGQNLMFIHTGGQPAVFGYETDLEPMLSSALS